MLLLVVLFAQEASPRVRLPEHLEPIVAKIGQPGHARH